MIGILVGVWMFLTGNTVSAPTFHLLAESGVGLLDETGNNLTLE